MVLGGRGLSGVLAGVGRGRESARRVSIARENGKTDRLMQTRIVALPQLEGHSQVERSAEGVAPEPQGVQVPCLFHLATVSNGISRRRIRTRCLCTPTWIAW